MAPKTIEVRELAPGDIDDFCRIRLHGLIHHPRSFWETDEEFTAKPKEHHLKRLQETYDADDKFILGAYEDGELMGIVGFNREGGTKGRHRGSIWGMYVHRDHQGKGIGSILLKKAIERARTIQDIEVLFLFVAPENTPALRLYKACGFESYGVEPYSMKFDGKYYEEEMMYLKL